MHTSTFLGAAGTWSTGAPPPCARRPAARRGVRRECSGPASSRLALALAGGGAAAAQSRAAHAPHKLAVGGWWHSVLPSIDPVALTWQKPSAAEEEEEEEEQSKLLSYTDVDCALVLPLGSIAHNTCAGHAP
jgi:hypothetical protein